MENCVKMADFAQWKLAGWPRLSATSLAKNAVSNIMQASALTPQSQIPPCQVQHLFYFVPQENLRGCLG